MRTQLCFRRTPAFTLIELLVVIAIIGLLSSIVLASLNSARAKARDARRIADLREVQKALEMYYADHGRYPPSARGYGGWDKAAGHCPNYGNYDANYIQGLVPQYLSALPKDPRYDEGSYCYLYRSDGTNYTLLAHLTMETVCDGSDGDSTPDPGDECNPSHFRVMDRVCCEQPTIAVYAPGARGW